MCESFKVITDAISQSHLGEYKTLPEVVSCAPSHINLIGENSWFFKDKTLSVALNIPLYFAISRRDDCSCRSFFVQTRERRRATVNAIKLKKDDKWSRYIKAIIEGFSCYGYEIGGINCTVYTQMKSVGCFGFGAALLVAAGLAMRALYNFDCDDLTFFQVIKYANTFLDKLTYEADNYTVMYSKANSLFVMDYATGLYDTVGVPFTDKTLFIVDLNVPRFPATQDTALLDIQNTLILGDLKEDKAGVWGGWQYTTDVVDINEQLATAKPQVRRKLICIMREHKDVLDAMKALEKNDFEHFATTINHSNESFRDFYDLSSPETNWMLRRVSEFALDGGRVLTSCGRIMLKGAPRYVYAIIRNEDAEPFKQKLVEYEHIFNLHPSYWQVGTGEGARVLIGGKTT